LFYTGQRYYIHTQNTIAQLRENNVLLEQANAQNEATITRLREDAVRQARLQSELTTRLQQAESKVSGLRTRLSQIDITREALADPADMEQRINRGVDRLIERILEETGGEVDNSSSSTNTTE
jgi:small-conductance mechanosensitive channel